MDASMFSEADQAQIRALGLSEEEVLSQLNVFREPSPRLRLNRPCTIRDGIRIIPDGELPALSRVYQEAAREGRCLKFVPSSGTASRMLQAHLWFLNQHETADRQRVAEMAGSADERFSEIRRFVDEIHRFTFFEDLAQAMGVGPSELQAVVRGGRLRECLEVFLTPRGLNYAALPKALFKFHQYPWGCRTAVEEHLVEAAGYVKDDRGICRVHFTTSPEHVDLFETALKEVMPRYERECGARFEVGLSVQKPSTQTISVDLEGRPFRLSDGSLHFRPGGHGALLENLQDLQGDIVFIKNIDNIVPDRLKPPTFIWKEALAGQLVRVQRRVFSYLDRLMQGDGGTPFLDEVTAFVVKDLFLALPGQWRSARSKEKRDFLISALDRPLRVCGMVRNQGEPGGGPFWVEDSEGNLSLQIVESVQVDHESAMQRGLWNAATHFNPVDLVCGIRDRLGAPFDLRRYQDPRAVLITRKSKDGLDLKAMELPGLWNGAMAKWNTIFVEVPAVTFNPVKTLSDLLREAHQA